MIQIDKVKVDNQSFKRILFESNGTALYIPEDALDSFKNLFIDGKDPTEAFQFEEIDNTAKALISSYNYAEILLTNEQINNIKEQLKE